MMQVVPEHNDRTNHGRDAHAAASAPAARAFTLLELLTVLLLLGVILTLSAPALSGFFAGRQTADAAQTVFSLTRSAHSISVSQGQLCRLNIDTQAGALWLTVQQGATFLPAAGDAGRRIQMPEDTQVSIVQSTTPAAAAPTAAPTASFGHSGFMNGRLGAQAASASYIDFYPTGRNDIATIEITGKRNERYQVTCVSATESFSMISPSEAK